MDGARIRADGMERHLIQHLARPDNLRMLLPDMAGRMSEVAGRVDDFFYESHLRRPHLSLLLLPSYRRASHASYGSRCSSSSSVSPRCSPSGASSRVRPDRPNCSEPSSKIVRSSLIVRFSVFTVTAVAVKAVSSPPGRWPSCERVARPPLRSELDRPSDSMPLCTAVKAFSDGRGPTVNPAAAIDDRTFEDALKVPLVLVCRESCTHHQIRIRAAYPKDASQFIRNDSDLLRQTTTKM